MYYPYPYSLHPTFERDIKTTYIFFFKGSKTEGIDLAYEKHPMINMNFLETEAFR